MADFLLHLISLECPVLKRSSSVVIFAYTDIRKGYDTVVGEMRWVIRLSGGQKQ